jgi:predicted nucleic acid-binding protein
MAAGFLMDTSAAIKYLNHTLPESGFTFIDNFINKDRTISFITEIELQAWNPVNPADMILYKQFVEQAIVVSITMDIIAETIEIRKNYRLKIADAIIAATAIRLNRTLIGDNDSDFSKIPPLQYINPRTM